MGSVRNTLNTGGIHTGAAKMPFKPIAMPKCPKCDKSVYAAEERIAGGYKYHKTCFKCDMCNKGLDSTNCNEKDAALYCKLATAENMDQKDTDLEVVLVP